MEPNDSAERQQRGACLTILLTGSLVGGLLMIVVLATGGWAVYAIGIVAGVTLFGLFHYLLWGRLMLQLTAGEREEEEVRRKAEERQRREGETDAT